jgi:hypothetical protein
MMRTLLPAATLLMLMSARASAADDKCTIATKGDSIVAKACAKGGRPEAKKLMKATVKTAKEKGTKFTCDGCHKNYESYELTPKARDDFKKLLEAAG